MGAPASIEHAVDLLRNRSRILVFTGAGISTESGIPDFRGPQGVWTKVDPADFTIDRYLNDPETRRRSWRMRHTSGSLDAKPNAAHHAVTALWHSGRMIGCVTQNIDGLHQKAGLPEDALVELHGNAHETVCVGCGDRMETTEVLERISAGDEDPRCLLCNGILKTSVIMFGEMLSPIATDRALAFAATADAVVSVGSTLSVFPAAAIPLEVVGAGHPLVIVNRGPTEFDDLAAVRIEAAAGDVLPRLITSLR
jgi:NAD-dependent deacetylase